MNRQFDFGWLELKDNRDMVNHEIYRGSGILLQRLYKSSYDHFLLSNIRMLKF